MRTPKLTPVGQQRVDILYTWLKQKRIKMLFVKRMKESVDQFNNKARFIQVANDKKQPLAILFSCAFMWIFTPEDDEYWYEMYKEFVKWYKNKENDNS